MNRLLILAVICCLGVAQVALADDIRPPQWRGQWSTTYQYWNFDTDDNGQAGGLPPAGPGPLIEVPWTPGYLPSTNVVVYPSPPVWYATDPIHGSDRTGIWPLCGSIDVTVDNHEPPNEFKWVWVQVTWAIESLEKPSVPLLTNLDPPADPGYPVTLVDEYPHGDGWYTSTYEWRIYPNPVDEHFTIAFEAGQGVVGGGILVDQLVIDTWCIPEPATLGLLLCGSLAVLRKRRK